MLIKYQNYITFTDIPTIIQDKIREQEFAEFNNHIFDLYKMDQMISFIIAFESETENYVGHCSFKLAQNADIYVLLVDDNFRKIGVGQKLLTEIKTEEIIIEVNENNRGAINFYENIGFEFSHIRKNYYPDGNALVYIWRKNERV